jgi:alpha-D-ribose 1-methylphosphonate 5-triphosphate synthase subunit PhnH
VAIQSPIQPGLRDAGADSQTVFRAAMMAMARPGRAQPIRLGLDPPPPLSASAAALLLTLCDFETSVWLDLPLARAAGVAQFLRFHTGARLVTAPVEANYGVICDSAGMPPLTAFAQGTPDYPDRSATLILQVEQLDGSGWKLEGPGIPGHIQFSACPLPDDFPHQVRANRTRFPCGVDIFLAAANEIAALPRSTRLLETG